jgi:hypothetical protein
LRQRLNGNLVLRHFRDAGLCRGNGQTEGPAQIAFREVPHAGVHAFGFVEHIQQGRRQMGVDAPGETVWKLAAVINEAAPVHHPIVW